MQEPVHSVPVPTPLPGSPGPTAEVERGGVRFTLLGTAHVSRHSADEVARVLAEGDYDAVAIELDEARYAALTDPDRWAKLDLFEVFRQGKAGVVAASLALGAFQQRLADQLGIEPGAEMRTAIRAADEAGLPLLLIDRDIGVTLRRVYRNVPWWQRMTLVGGLLGSVLSREEIGEEEIERLKQGDMLEATFTEFAEESAALYEPLIAERDLFMAARLEQELTPGDAPRHHRVLVVIGAGHLKGLEEHLRTPVADPDAARAELERVPPPSRLWSVLPWALVAVVLTGFGIGFQRNPELGLELVAAWVLLNGGLAGLGAAIALAHPLTVLATFVAAPFTSLNPFIGAGFVAAFVELWLRKPSVRDFEALRQDVTTARGWWRNRVARTFLVFLLATLGSVAGTYLGAARIFQRLL